MVQSGTPKKIWDDALDFEVYVRSNMDLDVYILQGEVPEIVMLGGTSDIRNFCIHGFYDWVILRDKPIQYLDENPVLGRYLGLSIDVGPSMAAKIMKANR